VAVETVEEVLRLYREKYHDLNMRHFHEKLSEEHQIHYLHVGAAGAAIPDCGG
jgi:hypothetical protein